MSLNVKQVDNVVVIAGKDKGKTGRVLSANPSAETVKVDNVNIITKHRKPRGPQQPGGKTTEPGNIHVSNVQIICPSCNKATRVKAGEAEGKKARVCVKCGASLDAKAKVDKKKKSAKAETETVAEKKPAKKTVKKVKEETETVKEEKAVDTEKKPAKKKAEKAPEAQESK